jgi:drug/metabolite transporter (DMT)-like permease
MGWLLFTSLLWAFSFGLIKHHLTTLDPAWVAFLRLSLSLLVFVPFVRPRAITSAMRVQLAGIGAVQFGLMYVAYIAAFHRLESYQVALLTLTTPVFVCLCSNLLARRLDWSALLAATLALVGASIAMNAKPLGRAEWTGVVLVQLSNICFAAGQVLYRRWKQRRPTAKDHQGFAWLYLGGTLSTLPFVWHSAEFTPLKLDASQVTVLIYLGIIASGLGFFLWNRAAVRVKSAQLAVMNNAKIPLAIALSILVFGESAHLPRLALGTAIMVAATVLANRTAVD